MTRPDTTRWPRVAVALAAALLFVAVPVHAEDGATETAKVRSIAFGKPLTLQGRIEGGDTFLMQPKTKRFGGPFKIAHLAPLGQVSEGDLLVRFEPEAYGDAVDRSAIDLDAARRDLEAKERGIGYARTSAALERKQKREALRRAEDDLAYWNDVLRPAQIEEAEYRLDGQRNRLADQKEELAQLEKMYGEDDLTEETEEIVLSRARRGLQRSLRSLEFSLRRHRRWMQENLARDQMDREVKLEKAKLAWDMFESSWKDKLRKLEGSLRKARMDLAKKEEAHDELVADREALEVRAPYDGTLLPGAFAGAWSGTEAGKDLAVGDTMSKGKPLRTLISAGALVVKAKVDEANLLRVAEGALAGVQPKALGGTELRGIVTDVSRFGQKGSYEVHLQIQDAHDALLPGMTAKVMVVPSDSPKALVVPTRAVAVEDGATYVHVVEGVNTRRVAIVPGAVHAAHLSVAKGLEAGQEVVLHETAPALATKKPEGAEANKASDAKDEKKDAETKKPDGDTKDDA